MRALRKSDILQFDGPEPEDTRDRIAWWREKTLATWRRGETLELPKRSMAAFLGFVQAGHIWRKEKAK